MIILDFKKKRVLIKDRRKIMTLAGNRKDGYRIEIFKLGQELSTYEYLCNELIWTIRTAIVMWKG